MKRRFLVKSTLALGALCGTGTAQAQTYPTTGVKMVVGFSPGGTVDVVARVLAEHLTTTLGQTFIVDNRTGANGMLAAQTVAKAEPDGHTIFVSNSSSITLNPTLFKNLTYDPERDFTPVTTVVAVPLILAVNPDNPETASVKTFQDFLALVKAKPGAVPFGSAGVGNITHLAFELLGDRAGFKMMHVPYRGAAAAQAAIFSKEVIAIFDTMAAVPHVRTGKLRALAVSSSQRLPALPDVPTVAELGYPGFDITFWVGLFVPKATPQGIVDRLNREVIAATAVPAVRAKLEMQGGVLTQTPAAFAAKVKSETAELAAIVAKAKITVE
ncbi:tripartite tricarboxylate transporter substrate binding protein [Vineibacter terrae]|uniref:Tripartite tricarboxylate transporter substrate binding protein n=1 Tax=Vineibacter terrae TaxID=2586908 RepID=A0A5C8PRZ8_9HYPH|nr:tripartite tricarboxylate transporter substrate binding protein [Vineibacter terrae]TXL77692.1 tripartite tricarboxylate transporter substrate binding protein [Vineibacter terrae]